MNLGNLFAAIFCGAVVLMFACFLFGNTMLGGILFVGLVAWVLREAVVSDRGES
jgi:hypothetical protein